MEREAHRGERICDCRYTCDQSSLSLRENARIRAAELTHGTPDGGGRCRSREEREESLHALPATARDSDINNHMNIYCYVPICAVVAYVHVRACTYEFMRTCARARACTYEFVRTCTRVHI